MNTDGQDVTTRKGKGNQRDQSGQSLVAGAEGGPTAAAATNQAAIAKTKSARAEAAATSQTLRTVPPCYTCKLNVKVSLFFDGTGNNLDADVVTNEHSNVARLFRSHDEVDPVKGIYRLYIPGLGTYFKDIGDPGDEDGLAFGKRGEPRLQHAMKKLDEFVANHPAANITGLDISIFGFSRGAALARAFALRVQERCKSAGTHWNWDKGGFPASITFMGLFDTVASVGLPASAGARSLRIAKGWVSLDDGLTWRRQDADNGLEPIDDRINLGIAFGTAPGADPTPGFIDGHGSWASNLRLPAMVAKCVHYTASHEVRNSFPLDSARDGNQYQAGTDERVYPGVHSNVGGGYRPGEGGRSLEADQLLSLLPLRAMHDEALAAGVPLSSKDDPRSGSDFVIGKKLIERFNAYVELVGKHASNLSLEGRLLAAMKLHHAWRFQRIRERGRSTRSDAASIEKEEQKYEQERRALDREIEAAERAPSRVAAERDVKQADAELASARAAYTGQMRREFAAPSQLSSSLSHLQKAEQASARAHSAFAEADDPHMRLVARRATLGGSGLVGHMNVYDRHLLLDVRAIQNVRKAYPRARLRPHYANLMEAYEAEFVRGKGLLAEHAEVLAFFDNYVHDSLAGFAKDATLPSDPRVVYIGGDRESRYAKNDAQSASSSAVV